MNDHACQLHRLVLGPWPTNGYVLVSDGESLIVDPAWDVERILDAIEGTVVRAIVLTHAHPDHAGALAQVRRATGAPVHLHPADAEAFGIDGDADLCDGDVLTVGRCPLHVVHTPGHTPGSVCLRFDRHAIVGDTLFPGGPGHSVSPAALQQLLASLRDRVFTWPDETAFYPGHGEGSTIGAIRPAFQAFLARPHPADLCGDVEWEL
ncbi:MAG: MBL fold metallo-hydrolase [Chloroflexi bacterium]|nr:MBL fold metallo-hydrolase [Chloroflexota bacterium]MBU1747287.1 MBL fold metallo-hydrolase [Chloroflexota bacterium]MBU1879588.1 MBL fold metallo-hydrolase [Chloroflexota bacterium]